MTCGEVRHRFDAVGAGTLSADEHSAVRVHLACCAACRDLLDLSAPRAATVGVRTTTPLLLIVAVVGGGLLLSRCDKTGSSTAGGGGSTDGTQVAQAPETPGSGATDATGQATQAPVQGHPAQIPPGSQVTAPIGEVKVPDPPVTPTHANMAKQPVEPKGTGPAGASPAPRLPDTPAEQPRPTVKWPELPGNGEGPTAEGPSRPLPTAPRPPTGPGTAPGVTPPAPVPGTTPEEHAGPPAPSAPAGTGTESRPGDIKSPDAPTPGEQPSASPGASGSADPEQVAKMVAILDDLDRAIGDRVRAARELGKLGDAVSAEALLRALVSDPDARLREASAESLGAIRGPHGQSALRRALESQPAGSFDLIATLADALRRSGVRSYLAQRLTGDCYDFSPRIRARGALGAGGGEVLELGARLVELLRDQELVATAAPRLAGRALPGLSGDRARIEVRHAAWRGLTLLAGGADFGFDGAAWGRFLERRAKELGVSATVPATPAVPPAFGGAPAEALVAALPELPRALASRDPQVLDDLLYQLRTTLDFPGRGAAAGDPVAGLVAGLPKFADAAARDAFCAPIYVAAVQRRSPAPLSAVLGLADAGAAGRQVYVSMIGAGGVGQLVTALHASTAAPDAQYRDGGALLRILDGFRPGADPERTFCERGQKSLDAQAADAEAFAAAVADVERWWADLGGAGRWDAASATIQPPGK